MKKTFVKRNKRIHYERCSLLDRWICNWTQPVIMFGPRLSGIKIYKFISGPKTGTCEIQIIEDALFKV